MKEVSEPKRETRDVLEIIKDDEGMDKKHSLAFQKNVKVQVGKQNEIHKVNLNQN